MKSPIPRTDIAVRFRLASWLVSAILLLTLPLSAKAVPAFTRQTGASCSLCHTQSFGPALTQYGRNFKLHGYVDSGAANPIPLVSGMIMGSLTHTDAGIPDGPAPGYGDNDNYTLDQASIFIAGRVLSHLGVFSQITYDGVADIATLDNTELRGNYHGVLGGHNVDYGWTLNNSPTVQDLWNTTPVWGFPVNSSPLAPSPGAATLVDGRLGGQVGGATLYAMIADNLYIEAGAYMSFTHDVQRAFGTFAADESRLDGGAPYWRITYQNDPNEWQGHYFAIGHFGLHAEVFPGRVTTSGTDGMTDLGFDATYQYIGSYLHIVEARATYIWEERHNRASQTLGDSVNLTDHLNTFRLNGTYTYQQTYSVNLGYQNTWGTRDDGLFGANPIDGSRTGRPDSEALIAELDYVPFGKIESYGAPSLNLKLTLQYINYLQFNGATHDYDGFGRDAGDNNTLLLNAWFIF